MLEVRLQKGVPRCEGVCGVMEGTRNRGENLGSGGTDHQQPKDEQFCDTVDLY